jgi:hypothetical protein
MNNAGDLQSYNIKAEKFNVALSDNTAATLCVIPSGKTCLGAVVVKFIGASAVTIESLNWSIASGSMVVTPQMTSNGSGTAEILVLFAR